MHDRITDHLRDAVGNLDDVESPEQIERQRSTFLRLQHEIARNPADPDPFHHLGYSDAAHDAIIYQQGQP